MAMGVPLRRKDATCSSTCSTNFTRGFTTMATSNESSSIRNTRKVSANSIGAWDSNLICTRESLTSNKHQIETEVIVSRDTSLRPVDNLRIATMQTGAKIDHSTLSRAPMETNYNSITPQKTRMASLRMTMSMTCSSIVSQWTTRKQVEKILTMMSDWTSNNPRTPANLKTITAIIILLSMKITSNRTTRAMI